MRRLGALRIIFLLLVFLHRAGALCHQKECLACLSNELCLWSPSAAACHPRSDLAVEGLRLESVAECYIAEAWHTIHSKLLSLTQGDVDNALTSAAASLPPESRRTASLLVAHASRWAGRRAMSTLANAIHKTKEKFLADGRSSMLSDVLRYFVTKKGIEHDHSDIDMQASTIINEALLNTPPHIDWGALADGSCILVDSLFLSLLETTRAVADNPLTTAATRDHIADQLQEGKLRLLIPLGWVSGVTIFNQRRLGAVAAALATRFAVYMKDHDLASDRVTDDVIDKFLQDHVLQRLAAALQIPVEEVEKQVVWLDAPVPPADALVAHYAQHMPSLRDFVRVMQGWAGGRDWTKIFQLLRDHAAVYSFNRLASLAESVGAKLRAKYGDLRDKWFIIPYRDKSFSVTNMLYVQNVHDDVDASQFLPYHAGDLQCARHYIVLDDLSSTGDQMETFQLLATDRPDCGLDKIRLTAALLVATPQSMQSSELLDRTDWVAASIVALPPESDQPLRDWPGSYGHKFQAALFAFPYMSPDNNAVLGAKALAPLFVPLGAVKCSAVVTMFEDSAYEDGFDRLRLAVRERETRSRRESGSAHYPLVWL